MYAVIKTGGKQYRVQPGDLLVVEKVDGDVGGEVAFDQVMMLGGADGGVTVGSPLVEGAVVRATLVETRKGDKIKVFKKIRRQGYRRTKGHRQLESVLRVTGLEGGGETARWDGEVDLTPRSVLRARARGRAAMIERADVAAQPTAPAPVETVEDVELKNEVLATPVEATPEAEAAPKPKRAPKPKAAAPEAETAESVSATDAEGGSVQGGEE